jgi:hypothetical protein
MPRRRLPVEPISPDTVPAVHVIHADAIYTVEMVRHYLGLRKSTVRREVRERRLRVSKRAGRYFITGDWLLAWIKAGELRPGGAE